MSAAVVSKKLAEGLVNHLTERRESIERARATWRAAEAEADAAREREADGLDAAHAAQLNHDVDEAELTRGAVELHADAERAAHAARQARRTLADAVEEAEMAAMRSRARTPRMASDDAALVERAVHETLAHARAARDEARLGPPPQEAADCRRDALACAPALEPSKPNGAGAASPTATPQKKRRRSSKPRIVVVNGVEIVVGVDSMEMVLQLEHVGCRTQAIVEALNKNEIEGAALFGDGKNPPWAVPRRALVAWGLARRGLPVAP
jgi:hypothetical protein